MHALRQAIWSKNANKLEELLKNGADPNKPYSDETRPLYSSIINGSDETTAVLLKYGADPNLKMDEGRDHSSALGCAMLLNRKNTVYLLLQYLANIHAKEDIHATVHDYAFMFNRFEIIDMFYRANKETLFVLVMVANRLSSEEDNALALPRELWRNIVVQFSPIGIKIPF